jgi:hypothetical protein
MKGLRSRRRKPDEDDSSDAPELIVHLVTANEASFLFLAGKDFLSYVCSEAVKPRHDRL